MEESKEDSREHIINGQDLHLHGSEEGDSIRVDQYKSLSNQLQIPDSVKTPIPLYKYKSTKNKIYLVDLVEDSVRNRCVFPLVALAFYVTLVLTLQDLLRVVH